MILKILTVMGLATFEIYAAIPAGFAFKLPALTIFFATLTGGLIGVFVSAYLGKQITKIIAKYRKHETAKKAKQPGFLRSIWDKFGVIGLGLVGTITVGAPVSIGVGVGFNVPLNKMVLWCCLGVFIRCMLFTALGHFGMKLF